MTSANLEDAQKAPEPPKAEGLSDNNDTEGPPDTGDHPKVALAIAAHPDDPDFGCAGTQNLWTKAGWDFYVLIVTDGSKGTEDASLTADKLIPMRQDEQRAASATQGVKDVFFLDGYVDGELYYSRQLLGDIVRVIRRLKPYAVFTHEPQQLFHRMGFVNHNDHRHTGLHTVDAVYPAARDRWNFPEQIDEEGLETHKVKQLYIWGNDDPNFTTDITGVVDEKIEGLLKHTSQFGQREDFMKFVRERWKGDDGKYTERFRRIVLAR